MGFGVAFFMKGEMMKMNVGIIGAGAIGLLLATYLSEEHAVTLYTRQEQEVERSIIPDGQASRLVRIRKIDRLQS
jgi:2-dehydropantoate 2-reductase